MTPSMTSNINQRDSTRSSERGLFFQKRFKVIRYLLSQEENGNLVEYRNSAQQRRRMWSYKVNYTLGIISEVYKRVEIYHISTATDQ